MSQFKETLDIGKCLDGSRSELFSNSLTYGIKPFVFPWGNIYKSNAIEDFYEAHPVSKQIKSSFKDGKKHDIQYSVSLFTLSKHSKHKPYMRLVNDRSLQSEDYDIYDPSVLPDSGIYYLVLDGSVKYIKDGKLINALPNEIIQVMSGDISGFQAGESGAMLLCIMYPPFEEKQFINEL